VGAVNCLSRCTAARDQLLASNMVEDALVPELQREGANDDAFAANIARTTMAIANLSGLRDSMFACDERREFALRTIVKILRHALLGRSWACIHFAPYSVLFPTCKVACSESETHKLELVRSGITEHLVHLISEWKSFGRQPEQTLKLALRACRGLCSLEEAERQMRDEGIVSALFRVATSSEVDKVLRAHAMEVIDKLLAGHVAVWMGQHARLGAASYIHLLDDYATGLILQYSFGCSPIMRAASDDLSVHGSFERRTGGDEPSSAARRL
jgi:hypothetical protein